MRLRQIEKIVSLLNSVFHKRSFSTNALLQCPIDRWVRLAAPSLSLFHHNDLSAGSEHITFHPTKINARGNTDAQHIPTIPDQTIRARL